MEEFFHGFKQINAFVFTANKGKTILECKVSGQWEPVVHDTARCGASITCKLSRKIGLKKSDKEVLDNHVKGAIGIEGLINFEAQAKEQISREIIWDIAQEEERTVNFPSPEYGRYMALQYQLIRYYNLRYQDHRFFVHKNSWQHSFCEHTKYFTDHSKKINYDPACNPPEPPGPLTHPTQKCGESDYDGLFQVDLGNVGMLVGFKRSDKGVEVDFNGKWVSVDSFEYYFTVDLPKIYIPESLLFFGKITDDICKATFIQYSESPIEVPHFCNDDLIEEKRSEQGGHMIEMEI